jgi:predicted nucleic acid-binding protein
LNYLVDTCAVSELLKPKPAPLVIGWFQSVPQTALCLSVLTLGDIRRGIEKLAEGERRRRVAAWLELELPAWFGDRVLGIDAAVADEWGRLAARCNRTMPAMDGLIAATALRHRLTVVTRNVADFAGSGVDVLNPWVA